MTRGSCWPGPWQSGWGQQLPLVKARHTQPQSGLDSAEARRANALGAYALLPGADVAGRHVLLADDVVTSGATLSECARTLLEAGAAEVWCVTLAQARPS